MIAELIALGIAAVLLACGAAYCVMVASESGSRRVLCLMYHRLCSADVYESLSGPERVFTLPVERFEWQVKYLVEQGFAFLSPEQVKDFAAVQQSVDGPAVMITFDDGCRSVATLGAAVLKAHNACATLFVTTDPNAEVFRATPNDPRLDDGEIAELDGDCIQIESHAVTHRPLSGLEESEMRSELADSRSQLENLLKREVRYFAIPGNWFNQSTMDAAREVGYEAVWCSNPGVVQPGADAFPFPRVNIDGDITNKGFISQISPSGIARREFVAAAKQLPGRILGPRIWGPIRRTLLSCMPGGYLSMRRVMLVVGVAGLATLAGLLIILLK